MMARRVFHERLDGLAADDPQARRSRRDLQRINGLMGNRAILLRELQALPMPPVAADSGAASMASGVTLAPPTVAGPPQRIRILEIGAGDGSLMLAVARRLAPRWLAVDLTLLDRAPVVPAATLTAFTSLGWRAKQVVLDVLDWAAPTSAASAASASPPGNGCWDLIVANLFLHHFEGPELARLLGAIAARCDAFCACEPRRGWLPLAASRLVAAAGANAVTREDAVLSVRAGFRDDEIGALWPDTPAIWDTREAAAGLFSHCFTAQRRRVTPIGGG